MDNRYITTTLIVAAVITTATAQTVDVSAQAVQSSPRLVVSITIDKLSTMQLEKYAQAYGNGGFMRLISDGTVYSNGICTFTPVDRASGIAAIVTGTTPYYNGVTATNRLDRATLQPVSTVNGYAGNITCSTITDELKIATAGRGMAYSIAEDENTALITGGHAVDASIFIDDKGRWKVSLCNSAVDLSWLNAFNKLDNESSSTYAYERLTAMAVQCVQSAGMGLDAIPDILTVTYTAVDSEDAYVSLDKSVASLMEKAETAAGKGNVLFVVSGDGCEERHTEDLKTYGIPTGTFNITRAQSLLNMFLGATYGDGKYAEAVFDNALFLNEKLIEQRGLNVQAIEEASATFLKELSGVRNVYTRSAILTNRCPENRVVNAFNLTISGDLIIEIAPGWSLLNENTQASYNVRAGIEPFPIIFYGCGIAKDTRHEAVASERIAPTIAKSIRIRAPNGCTAQPLF